MAKVNVVTGDMVKEEISRILEDTKRRANLYPDSKFLQGEISGLQQISKFIIIEERKVPSRYARKVGR